MGATWRHYRARLDDGHPLFETTRPLGRQEGLTIVVSWPKGYVTAPGELARLGYFLRDNRPFTWSVLGLIALLGYYLFVWKRVGRDPPRGVVIPRYRPPDGESPASMRYLLAMRYDNRCLVAGILSLAVKGYLTIEQDAGGLFRKGKYTLSRTGSSQTPLSPDERALLRALLGGRKLSWTTKPCDLVAREGAHEAALTSTCPVLQLNTGWRLLGGVLVLPLVGGDRLASTTAATAEWFMVTPGGWEPGVAVRCSSSPTSAPVAGAHAGRPQADGRDRGLPPVPVGSRGRRARAGRRSAQDAWPV
jgi:hypothetical protein